MKRMVSAWCIVALIAGLWCAEANAQKSLTVQEVVKNSKVYKTAKEKAQYLFKQAQQYYSSKEYQKAIDTAKYILSNVDNKYQPAQALIEKAQKQLAAATQNKAAGAANKLLGK